MPTTAKVIADSISESGVRLTTLVLEYPRIIHSEFMTHRMFSRNASSSRAIPVEKQIERVENDPFVPTYWGKNERGMQAFTETNQNVNIIQYGTDWSEDVAPQDAWLSARDSMVDVASGFTKAGYHKQLANRLLEPFSHIQVVCTATEWDNFFAQRLHPDAQPEIQELARVMKEAMDASTPKLLKAGEWHLPFVKEENHELMDEAHRQYKKVHPDTVPTYEDINKYCDIIRKKVSVARCARVSYGLNERGWGDIDKDLALYDMLLTNNHMSPFEHQATPMVQDESESWEMTPDAWEQGITHADRKYKFWSGNFKGWVQNRQLIEQQNG